MPKNLYKHWLMRALTQQFLWRMPLGMRLNTLLAKHDPAYELREKHWPYFRRHQAALIAAGFGNLQGKSVLEIGTGWDFDVALLFRLCRCDQVTTADAFRHVDLEYVRRALDVLDTLAPELASQGLVKLEEIQAHIRDWREATSLDEFQHRSNVRYIAPISKDYREIKNTSVDLCYSTAVMEHIRPREVRDILTATRRKLKFGGYSSHVIDLKDHFAYFQPGLPYNHFLRFSERQWEMIAGNPMTYTNRLSATVWRELFVQCGYEIIIFEEKTETNLPPLSAVRIHPQNRHWSERDLRIGELHVIARRAGP